jgi:Protein of unknown function (DUF3575)
MERGGSAGRRKKMSVPRFLVVACVACGFVLCAIPVEGSGVEASADSSAAHRHIISSNPILDLFTWYNAEYEFALARSSTIGLAGSFISTDDDEDYRSICGFYRYYPEGAAPAGFFFGGRFGFYDVSDTTPYPTADEGSEETATFYGFGIDIGYTWLLGTTRQFALSLGIGAVRIFGEDLEDVPATLPTIRLVNIGIAF